MNVRKVQKTAAGTYLITIPKDWVSKMGLEKGGHVYMELEDEDLVINPVRRKQSAQSRPLNIDLVKDRKMLELSIGASYIQGHDVTEVISANKILPQEKSWIHETVDNLVGVEVAEEYADRVVLQNLVDPRTFDLDKSIKKFSDTSLAVLGDAIVGLRKGDLILSQDAYERGRQSTRLYRLLLRLVFQILRNRKLRQELKAHDIDDLLARLMAVKDLGRSAYYSYRVAQHVTELGSKLDSAAAGPVEKMTRTTIRMQEDALSAFLRKDLRLASTVIETMDEVRKGYEGIFSEFPLSLGQKALPYSLVVRDVRGVAGYAVALADDAVLAAFG